MLKINSNQWFDLNILGLIFILIIMILIGIFNIGLTIVLSLEVLLLVGELYLFRRIQQNKNTDLILNNENKWFIQKDGEMLSVELKDYWLQTNKIFIWLKGSNKSISIMVTRSIIGAENYSQLRTKIL